MQALCFLFPPPTRAQQAPERLGEGQQRQGTREGVFSPGLREQSAVLMYTAVLFVHTYAVWGQCKYQFPSCVLLGKWLHRSESVFSTAQGKYSYLG